MSKPKWMVGRIDGIASVVEMLQLLDENDRIRLLKNIASEDPELARKLQAELFTFNDLLGVDTRDMQVLIRQIPSGILLLSLRGAPEELKDHFFSGMSERAADVLKEELELQPPQRKSDIETARSQILEIGKRLESEGKILLKRPKQ